MELSLSKPQEAGSPKKEESVEQKQKEMDSGQANPTDVHPGGNIPIVLFMIILQKNE